MDLFRKTYRPLLETEKLAMAGLKDAAQTYADALEKFVVPSREKSLALTKIEESVFWAVKSITR